MKHLIFICVKTNTSYCISSTGGEQSIVIIEGRGIWPLNIHLRDALQLRQNALQSAHATYQVGGTPPILHNFAVEIY